jgi:hypothetical protein
VEPEDFRRLKISNTNTPSSSKLFNPERDPIPTFRRTAEPEAMSDTASSSYVSRSQSRPTGNHHQLFDHRKDDPVRFSVLARPGASPSRRPPTPKSSGEWVSGSSASSYAASQASSSFTLSSTTDGSSASSAIFDGRGGQGKPTPSEEAGNNVFAVQLKKLYRAITTLENKIKQEDEEVEGEFTPAPSSKILVKGKEGTTVQTISEPLNEDEAEKEMWKKRIADHKRSVFPIMLNLRNLIKLSLLAVLWKSCTIFLKSHSHPPSPPLFATSLQSTTSQSGFGRMASSNCSNP